MDLKEIGARLRLERQKNNKTLEEIADMLGCTAQALSRYERGTRPLKIETVMQLAQVFKVPVKTFLSESDYREMLPEKTTLKIDTSGIPQAYIDELPDTTDADMQQLSLDLDSDFAALKKAYLSLNDRGKREAAARVQELAEIPRYQHESDDKNV